MPPAHRLHAGFALLALSVIAALYGYADVVDPVAEAERIVDGELVAIEAQWVVWSGD